MTSLQATSEGATTAATTPRVGLMPGSIRRNSYNRLLAQAVVPLLGERGVAAELVDLGGYPMPFYDGDLEAEEGQPETAVALHDRLATLDGLIFTSPEYNGGPSALLKNAIDWVTRVDRGVFRTLLIGLGAASPGGRGGVTGLASMRAICEHMRLDVVDDHLSIPNVADAFEFVEGVPQFVRTADRARVEAYLDAYEDRLTDRLGGRDRSDP